MNEKTEPGVFRNLSNGEVATRLDPIKALKAELCIIRSPDNSNLTVAPSHDKLLSQLCERRKMLFPKRYFLTMLVCLICSYAFPPSLRGEDHQGVKSGNGKNMSAVSATGQPATYSPMPGPGKKVPIGSGLYIVFGFDKQPKLGTVIVKVQIYSSEGKKDTSLEVKADAGMPSMKGAHETGDRPFTLSKKGDYLLPVNIVMPGDWEIRLTIMQKGKVIFRGRYNFDV